MSAQLTNQLAVACILLLWVYLAGCEAVSVDRRKDEPQIEEAVIVDPWIDTRRRFDLPSSIQYSLAGFETDIDGDHVPELFITGITLGGTGGEP